ncbi:MAG: metallophosphoesterase [archaeon]
MIKKIAMFTDIHLGAKGNSKIHNQDCENFIEWFIEQAKIHNCDTCVFGGDFHHNRNNINISTLASSIKIIEKIGKSFEKSYFLVGNHDLYYKDRRDVHGIKFAQHINGINVLDEITKIDSITFVPWLVGDEWKKIQKIKSPIVIGHFELPNFYMNAYVKMPDTGTLKSSNFQNQKYVFSGHFHKRQRQGKINYIGNAFPHNFSDVWDNDRGMMVLDIENDAEPLYINWEDCPKYRMTTLSKLLDDPEKYLCEKAYVKVNVDVQLSYEEALYVKETLVEKYKCREITIVQQSQIDENPTNMEISSFESIDKIVYDEIANFKSSSINPEVLLEIYNQL